MVNLLVAAEPFAVYADDQGGRLLHNALTDALADVGKTRADIRVVTGTSTDEAPFIDEIIEDEPRVILAVGGTPQTLVQKALKKLAEYPVPGIDVSELEMRNAYAPGYLLHHPDVLDDWQQNIANAVRVAFGLPAIEPITPRFILPEEFGTPDLQSRWFSADTETDNLQEGVGGGHDEDDEDDEDTVDDADSDTSWGIKRVGWSGSDGAVTDFFTTEPWTLLGESACAHRSLRHSPNCCRPTKPAHVYMHEAKYDIPLLGVDPDNLESWDDTLLMAYCTRQFRRLSLKKIAAELTGIAWRLKITDLLKVKVEIPGRPYKNNPNKTTKSTFRTEKAPFSRSIRERWDDAREYAATDALVTARAAQSLEAMFDTMPWARRHYFEIEKPLLPVLLRMEQNGVRISRTALAEAKVVIDAKRAETEERLKEVFGANVNLNAPQQMGPILLDMGLVDGGLTKSGNVSVGKGRILAAFNVEREDELPDTELGKIAADIIDHRKMGKLKSTYVTAILDKLDPFDRIHPRLNQAGTKVDRLSSSNPNEQNIPVRTELGLSIRKAFVAPPGRVLVGGDFSQLQPRVWAEITRDPVFLAAYCTPGVKGDIYLPVAEELDFRKPDGSTHRDRAKPVVLGAMYGGADQTLGHAGKIPPEQMGAFLVKLHARLTSIKSWPDQIAKILAKYGYIESLQGFRMFYPNFMSPVGKWHAKALREAANAPIIATEAGTVKRYLVAVDRGLRENWPTAFLVLMVHDEAVVECDPEDADDIGAFMSQTAREVGRIDLKTVPLLMDTKTIANWAELK